MADTNIPSPGAPVAPAILPTINTLPNVADRLTVPASALGLETELPEDLKIPANGPAAGAPAPTGPAAPAATAPASTPPAATGQGSTGPTGPSATAPASTPPTATGPTGPAATPPKVKIGDKEYTTEELEKLLAERAKQNQQPTAPEPNQPLPPPPPTPEQIKAAENTWCETFIKDHGVVFPTTEAEVETLLGGGKDAVEFFTKKLTEVTARAVLLARKSVYADLNPQMEKFARDIAPLFTNHQQIERVSTEQAFLRAFPEYQGTHIETARQVAEALVERYPEHVRKMNQQQFLEAVNEQTDRILQNEYKRWNPAATDTWRDAAKRAATPPAATGPVAAATPAPVVPAPAATAPADPWRQAPAPNSPASTPAAGAPDWNKNVAKSLQD